MIAAIVNVCVRELHLLKLMVALVEFDFTVTPADAMSRVSKALRHHAKSAVVHIMASGTSSLLSTGCCSDSRLKTGPVPHRVVVS